MSVKNVRGRVETAWSSSPLFKKKNKKNVTPKIFEFAYTIHETALKVWGWCGRRGGPSSRAHTSYTKTEVHASRYRYYCCFELKIFEKFHGNAKYVVIACCGRHAFGGRRHETLFRFPGAFLKRPCLLVHGKMPLPLWIRRKREKAN